LYTYYNYISIQYVTLQTKSNIIIERE